MIVRVHRATHAIHLNDRVILWPWRETGFYSYKHILRKLFKCKVGLSREIYKLCRGTACQLRQSANAERAVACRGRSACVHARTTSDADGRATVWQGAGGLGREACAPVAMEPAVPYCLRYRVYNEKKRIESGAAHPDLFGTVIAVSARAATDGVEVGSWELPQSFVARASPGQGTKLTGTRSHLQFLRVNFVKFSGCPTYLTLRPPNGHLSPLYSTLPACTSSYIQ